MKIDEFAKELHESVLLGAGGQEGGEFREIMFTKTVIEWLVEVGECIDPQVCHFKAPAIKLNGWDLDEDSGNVDLFVTIFDGTEPMPRASKGELTDAARRCARFLDESRKGLWTRIDESASAYPAARELADHAVDIRRARIFVLTNSLTKQEVIPDSQLDGIAITHHIWDIEHLFQVFAGKAGPEPIEIDERTLKGGIRCVRDPDDNGVYTAYLGIIPGEVLASLYEQWGQRLLERNLRSFLQTKGKINQGIQRTIREMPEMFLAYNNGISTTADAVETREEEEGQCHLLRLSNFQIVNGGQTTANLLDAKRRGADLSRVRVQMKITVLKDPATTDSHVPLIARFANSQNKVSVSDFSSNNPYQVELERLSRRIWVPNPEQRGKSTTKWYYERARGQYLSDVLAHPTLSEKNKFKLLYPADQRLTKTLVAKYEMAWWQLPQKVSLGAEKNFANFMQLVSDSHAALPDERYFKHLVAKAILFEKCDRIVQEEEYPGYKANIVAYSVAFLSWKTASLLNLDLIWERQEVPPAAEDALRRIVRLVQPHLMSPSREGMNVGEWCKKEQCWTSLQEKSVELPDLVECIVRVGEASAPSQPPRVKDMPVTPEQEEMTQRASAYPPEVWFGLAAWGKETGLLSNFERSLTFSVGKAIARGRRPSPDQAKYAVPALERAMSKGFDPAKQKPRRDRK